MRTAAGSTHRQLLLLSVVSAAILLVVVAFATTGRWSKPGPGRVTGTDPVDGSAVDRLPDKIRLVLSGPADPALSHITVRDAAGTVVNRGEVRAAADELSQPVTATERGVFTVAYHVTFQDGREVVGSVWFSVGTGVPPPADTQVPPDAQGHVHEIDPLSAGLLAVDVSVLLGAVSLLLLGRHRRQSAAGDDHRREST